MLLAGRTVRANHKPSRAIFHVMISRWTPPFGGDGDQCAGCTATQGPHRVRRDAACQASDNGRLMVGPGLKAAQSKGTRAPGTLRDCRLGERVDGGGEGEGEGWRGGGGFTYLPYQPAKRAMGRNAVCGRCAAPSHPVAYLLLLPSSVPRSQSGLRAS